MLMLYSIQHAASLLILTKEDAIGGLNPGPFFVHLTTAATGVNGKR
jgi:hypothetical protein